MDTSSQWPQGIGVVKGVETSSKLDERKPRPQKEQAINCPRCNSTNTKFCYYNNYSLSQPRYFCKTCRRYWTEGGSLRNVPVGGGSRKNKRSNNNINNNNSNNNNSSSLSSPTSSSKKTLLSDLANPNDLNLTYNPIHTATTTACNFSSFSDFMALPLSHPSANSVYSLNMPDSLYASSSVTTGLPDLKPSSINFCLDGFGGDHHEAKLFFPMDDLKMNVSTANEGQFEENRGQEAHQSNGFWESLPSPPETSYSPRRCQFLPSSLAKMSSRVSVTVSQDGTGDYRTVQEAIDAVPLSNKCRTVIRVAPGVYKQPIYVPKTKNYITLAGFSPESTVLTWNNTATKIDHHQAARLIGTGTFGCGSTIVEGEDFIAENITFENSAPEGSGQAVAIRVTADRCAFYNCRFLGWQDTLYLHYGKQYLKDCYIEGSVDFIFGNSTALLEHCHIHCKSAGFITAQSRKSSQETTGYVFLRCVITGNGATSYTHLGRPWGPFGRVVFAYCYMDHCIKHVGWNNWGKTENERTACFYEYRCYGPGSCPSKRVTWARELMDEEAEQFIMHGFIDPDQQNPWLCQRMALRIPYSA